MGKPRKFTPQFKAKVALAAFKGDKPLAALCREHQLCDTIVIRWRQQLLEHAANIFADQTPTQRDPQQYAACRQQDTALHAAIEQIAMEFPRYGYRRMTAELRRRDWPVNRKRVLRLMRQGSLLVQVRRLVRISIYRPGLGHWPNLLREIRAEYPNHVWVADIPYVRVQEEFFFLAVRMDLYTRAIRGWHLGRTLAEELTYTALEQALTRHRLRAIHPSDHGIPYLGRSYVDKLQEQQTRIRLSGIGRPTENGFCERLMRTLKEEEVSLQDYADEVESRERIGHFWDEV